MGKIAIVGVEGSGKTVLMAALGAAYERPDENGMFLSPKNQEAFKFSMSYMHLMREKQQWPSATMTDSLRYLEWELRTKTEVIAELSILDYAGEIYRRAFSESGDNEQYSAEMETLLRHITEADTLLILINLRDVIDGDRSSARTLDTLWLNKAILEFARKVESITNVAIVLTQADRYENIIHQCGGPKGTLEKYLPFVMNIYHDIPVLTVSAVDKTEPYENGIPQPTKDFQSQGIKDIISWLTGTKEFNKIEKTQLNAEDNSVVKSLDMLFVPNSTQESDDNFWISKNMITRDQWTRVMEAGEMYHDNTPVVNISRDQALSFCDKLNQTQKRLDGYYYFLPTYVQWRNSFHLRKQNEKSFSSVFFEWCADVQDGDFPLIKLVLGLLSLIGFIIVIALLGIMWALILIVPWALFLACMVTLIDKLPKVKYTLVAFNGHVEEKYADGDKEYIDNHIVFSGEASSYHSENIGFRVVLTPQVTKKSEE